MGFDYKNGSSPETVYSDTKCTEKIGTLNPFEECRCVGIIDKKAIVIYNKNGTDNQKIGFVKYLGGIKW